MRFRPCIDIHNGKVKQIVGSSLRDQGDQAAENFVAEQDAAWFADFYRRDGLSGGHIILLNPASSEYYEATKRQALAALAAWPGGMMLGGGITDENAAEFLDAGASHVTHLFNAMPPIHHRNPGVIGAAAERENVTAELICDGLHVHPSVVRLAFKAFPGRICLISDSLRCCGMPDGEYELGGQIVFLRQMQARLADRTLAGAVSDLYSDMVNAIRFGIPKEQAIMAATINPAKVIGADHETGSLEAGKMADFVVCDKDWKLQQVVIGGKEVP